MTGAVNYYDAYLCRWRSDVVQFQAAVREFSERTAEQFLRQDRLAQVLQAAEGDKRTALRRYMSGTPGVTITECSYDEECDYTCLFFTAG